MTEIQEAPRFHWRGKPSTEMTRDDLLDLIDELASQLAEYRTPDAISAMAAGRARKFMGGGL